jgi:indole-3-glycerol phosphate synthase
MLEKIIKNKELELEGLKKINCRRNKKYYNLGDSLREKPIIAEIKKKSPSKGILNNSVDVVEQAKKYEKYGAGAVSVLTDKTFFNGDIEELYEISRNVKLPILCKDFILNKLQILNAEISGADVVLLITSILEKDILFDLYEYAKSIGLQVLLEVHSTDDLSKIESLDAEYVGINCRDLKTMKIDKQNALNLLNQIRDKGEFLKIIESGIETSDDIKLFKDAGADGFLIGTAFMEADNLKEKFEEFYRCL